MREVTHDLRLGELGQAQRRDALELRGHVGCRIGAHVPSVPTRPRELEEERLERRAVRVLPGVGDRLRADHRHRTAAA